MLLRHAVLAGALALALLPTAHAQQPAASADAPPPAQVKPAQVKVELNRLEQVKDDCQVTLVVRNQTSQAFTSLKPDLVTFGTDGVVGRRLAVELAPLPAGKTSLKQFAVPATPCANLGELLLNSMLSCTAAAGPVADDCLALVAVSHRGTVPFIR